MVYLINIFVSFYTSRTYIYMYVGQERKTRYSPQQMLDTYQSWYQTIAKKQSKTWGRLFFTEMAIIASF